MSTKKPAYGLISWTGGVFTLQYYNLPGLSNAQRQGYDLGVFDEGGDDLPVLDLRSCDDPDLIFQFIINNPSPGSVSSGGGPEPLEDYLKRYAKYCKIELKTLKQVRTPKP